MSPFVDHGTVLPRLSRAQAPLTREILAVNEFGETERLSIPAERALTVYVDKRELVTLMTLGAHPELLVLGYLRNQRLLTSPFDIESITVDWDVGAAAVKTHRGIDRIEEKTAKRVVTTGCGQGSVFGELMDEIDGIELPRRHAEPGPAVRHRQRHPAAGVHLQVGRLGARLRAVSRRGDAGLRGRRGPAQRHRHHCGLDVDEAGGPHGGHCVCGARGLDGLSEMALSGADKVFYTTGRLTSEMVIKSAQMGVPIVVSRSGITQMGHEVAQRLGLCAIGRATNRRFVCYAGAERLQLQPELAGPRLRAAA
jgi:FdhD protein